MDENKNNYNEDFNPQDRFDFKSAKEKSMEESDSKEYFVDRSEKVRNFIANMQSFEIEDMIETVENDKPEHKGEVYFSTAPRKKARVAGNTATQAKADDKKIKGNRKSHAVTSISTILLLIFIVGGTAILSITGINCIGDILAINRSKQQIEVTVPENTDVKTMIGLLADEGLIKSETFCNLFAKFRHMDSSEYLSGVYYMNSNMGLERMLNLAKLAQSEVETVEVTIPEGYTIYQIFQRLESYEVCKAEQLYATLEEIAFDYGFIDNLEESTGEYQKYEGYFFPDKYEFYEGENPTSVIKKFFDNYETKWKDEYNEKAKESGLTQDQIMIIASIIQKEATNSEQMKDISAVINNRLRSGVSYPRLECDATLEYVNNSIKQAIGEQLASGYNQYYDTYSCKGLPAGAICNPGIQAIEAAIYPNETANYYFLHDNSGVLYLAETFAEYESKSQEVLIANGAR